MVNNKWFFSPVPSFFKASSLFIKGDSIILFPFLLIILLIGFLSLKFMVIMIGIYIAVRYLGELIYWLLHQFGERKYRPPEYCFKNLDNHALYIIYQTTSIVGITVGIGIVIGALLFL